LCSNATENIVNSSSNEFNEGETNRFPTNSQQLRISHNRAVALDRLNKRQNNLNRVGVSNGLKSNFQMVNKKKKQVLTNNSTSFSNVDSSKKVDDSTLMSCSKPINISTSLFTANNNLFKCCGCNGANATCRNCKCAKNNSICTSCYPMKHSRCINSIQTDTNSKMNYISSQQFNKERIYNQQVNMISAESSSSTRVATNNESTLNNTQISEKIYNRIKSYKKRVIRRIPKASRYLSPCI
jgi:hypothetical protein